MNRDGAEVTHYAYYNSDRVEGNAVRCHLLRDGSNGCLLGYVTPMHGDPVRGDGVELEWD